ncbi:MAG: NAD-dependent epimerase/dehydratase family protein [Rhizobiaceae bacterium]|nr:NAD-dependent epimerase/dehydratase family protein [Rhizobiaceae bacterium]
MKIAVTGASGFLGQYVCRELLNQERAFQPFHFSNPVKMEGNVPPSKPLDLASLPSDLVGYLGNPDILIHLAWAGLPNYRNQDHVIHELPRQTAFLKSAIKGGVQSVFITGTCFEYGMQSGSLSENAPLLADNPYGEAKVRLLEELQSFQSQEAFNLVWGRLFYMFGDGQAANSLWPQFQNAVQNADPVFNMSGGQQLRDFLPVDDIAKLIVKLALSGQDLGVVNICSGKPISVEALVRNWARSCNWEGELNLGFYPYPDYEPMEFWGDRRKLNSILL